MNDDAHVVDFPSAVGLLVKPRWLLMAGLLVSQITGCIAAPPGGVADTGIVDEVAPGVDAGNDLVAADADSGRDAESVDACQPRTCADLMACGSPSDGCGGTLECGECSSIASVSVSPSEIAMIPGERVPLVVRVLDTEGLEIASPDINWTSSAPDIVSVEEARPALLAGSDDGTATVTALVDDVSATVEVEVNARFRAVAAGRTHTCALSNDEIAYCWGNGHTEAVGQRPGLYPLLQRVPTELEFVEIAAGGLHTCALEKGRRAVWCWGQNEFGQLGQPADVMLERQPTKVPLPDDGPYSGLTAGLYNTCVSLGRSPDLELYCWGANEEGQSDPEDAADISEPVFVTELADVDDLALGWKFGCGSNSTGTRCWGSDAQGQLGNGDPDSSGQVVSVVFAQDSPVLTEFAAVDAHVCALSDDGEVWCWGYNNEGQSDPLSEDALIHAPAMRGGTYQQVVAGARHSCAVREGDTSMIDCWGSNTDRDGEAGVLGATEPTARAGIANMSHAVGTISAGWAHTCALLADGTIWCWGAGADGQLGNGMLEASAVPVRAVASDML